MATITDKIYNIQLTAEEVGLVMGALALAYNTHSQVEKTGAARKSAHKYADAYMAVYGQMIEQQEDD